MMKHCKFIFLFSLLAVVQSLQAFYGCGSAGKWGIEAEWLYLRPSIETGLFAEQVQNINPSRVRTTARAVNPNYHSGWRLGALYQFCDDSCSLGVRWTQLHATDKKSVRAFSFRSPFTLVQGDNLVADDRLKFEYDTLEALYLCNFYRGCQFYADLFAGLAYSSVEVRERVFFTDNLGPNTDVTQKGKFRGIGPELGLQLDFCFWNGFSLHADGRGALLVSKVEDQATLRQLRGTNPITFSFNVPSFWKVAPWFDLRAGLRYETCLSCFNFYIEGGYEVISLVKGLKLLDTDVGIKALFSNADLHGPYIAAGFAF